MGVLMLLSAIAGAQPAQPQAKGELNTISKLEVRGGTIEISGTRKPSFTTFTMTDPPRLVIDISEAVFAGVPEEMQVGNGVVTAVKTASYGTGDRSIARILVGFTKDVETDIQTQEGRMTVKVLGSSGGDAVAGGPARGEQVAANTGTDTGSAAAATQRADQDRTAQQQAVQQSARSAEQDRTAQQQAVQQSARSAEQDRAAQEKATRDAAQAAAEDRRRQEQEAKDAAKRAAEDRLAQERAAKEAQRAAAEEDRRLKAEEAKAAAAEKQRKQEESQAAAAAEKQRKADEAKAAAAERQRKQGEAQAAAATEKQRKADAAKAAAEEKKRQQEEARAAAEEERQRKADEAKAAAEEKKRKAEEARAAAAEAKAAKQKGREVAMAEPSQGHAAQASSGGPPSVSARRKTITFLGFRQEAGASRIFIRTNEPVRYSVSPAGKNALVLELDNTAFGAANTRRALDTSFFDTAVARVVPAAGAKGKAARIEITLKSDVPYQARQEGNEVVLEFPRPNR